MKEEGHWVLKSSDVGFGLEKEDRELRTLVDCCYRLRRWKLRGFMFVGFIFFASSFEVRGKTIDLASQCRKTFKALPMLSQPLPPSW